MSKPFSPRFGGGRRGSASSTSSMNIYGGNSSSNTTASTQANLTNRSLFLQLFSPGGNTTLQVQTRWLTKYIAELRTLPPHERKFLGAYTSVVEEDVATVVAGSLTKMLIGAVGSDGDAASANDYGGNREVLVEATVFFTRRSFRKAVEALQEGGFVEAMNEALVAACVGSNNGEDAAAHIEFVKWLVSEKKCDIKYRNGRAFRCTVRDGNTRLCQILIDAGADVSYGDNAALILACELGHLSVVETLVRNGAAIAARNGEALSLACGNGHLDVMRHLIEQAEAQAKTTKMSADDIIHAQSDAALRLAAAGGHLEIINILLSHGADPNATEEWGNAKCAFEQAALNGDLEILAALAQSIHSKVAQQTLWKALSAVCFQGRSKREEVVDAILEIGDNMYGKKWVEEARKQWVEDAPDKEEAKEAMDELIEAVEMRQLANLIARLDI